MSVPDLPQLKPYELRSEQGVLTVTIRKEFDFGSLHQDWAHSILTLHPGPYQAVRIDMTQVGLVSSTFFAGLMQLHFHYTERGLSALVLVQPDPRVLRNLKIMRMDGLFAIEPRDG
jgi:anti-anti-sigma regulatory factor